MNKVITLDMDGTLADFYGVPHWLEKIRAYDASPYAEAKPMINMNSLARQLNRLQRNGYIIRIVTWGSKESCGSFDSLTSKTKQKWLQKHLPSVHWDEFVFSAYGVDKSSVGIYHGGILFDDNESIRNSWKGVAYKETQILSVLKTLGR